MRLEGRWATAADLRRFYGERAVPTCRARVLLADGEPVAVAGWAVVNGVVAVFSELKPDARRYPAAVWREANETMRCVPDGALCRADENEPTAPRFLRRLGWRQNGEVYEWRTR